MRHVVSASCILLAIGLATAVACRDEQADHGSPADSRVGEPAKAPSLAGLAIPSTLPPSQRREAELAARVLVRECGLDASTWSDFAESNLEVRKASGYLREDLDWDNTVSITLVHKPSSDPESNGHHFLFRFGAGKRPGFVTGKRGAKKLCRFAGRATGPVSGSECNLDNSDDCFLDVPELEQLDIDRPAAIAEPEPHRTSIRVTCFGYGVENPPEFWQCRTNASECTKARNAEKKEENEDYRVRTRCSSTTEAHCFRTTKTICAPSAEACVRTRKAWTALNNEASPCERATKELLEAATQDDDDD